jgi:hypothetical protein
LIRLSVAGCPALLDPGKPTESVAGEEQVSDEVRKERIETEGDAAPGR